jgi:hypothetical protein
MMGWGTWAFAGVQEQGFQENQGQHVEASAESGGLANYEKVWPAPNGLVYIKD